MCVCRESARARERERERERERFYLFFDRLDSGSKTSKVVDSRRMLPEFVCEGERAHNMTSDLCGISLIHTWSLSLTHTHGLH